MFTKNINPKIQQTLRAKEIALSRTVDTRATPNIPRFPDNISANAYNDITDIATRSVFFRMISNKLETDESIKNVVISGGERNEDGTMKFGLTTDGKGAYHNTKVDGESQSGIRHIAGIKDVEVAYKDQFKAIREANVSWVVGSIEDLERLTPHFLTVGKTVMIDWGWINPKQGIEQQFGGQTFYQGEKISNRLFTQSQSKILDIGGNYGAMGGVISNFDYQLRQDGGFDCNTKIIALGSTLFKKPIDKGMNDRAILGKKSIEAENSDDETEDKIDVSQSQIDSFMLAIVNLREIILEGIFYMNGPIPRNKLAKAQTQTLFKAMHAQAKAQNGSEDSPEHWKATHLPFEFSSWVGDYKNNNIKVRIFSPLEAVSPKEEVSNVIAMINNHSVDADRIYVTWGFFEDQILNRYISYVGEDQELKMTIRSITPTMENGVPDFDKMESVKISNHKDLYSKDLGKYLLSGQNNMKKGDFGGDDGAVYEEMIHGHLMPSFVNNRTQKFKEDDTTGNIRDIFVSIQEIQKAFGVGKNSERTAATEKGHIMLSDLNPPSSVEAGLKRLLKQMSENFFDIWDFELTCDPYNSTNVKIIDKNYSKEAITYSDVDNEIYKLYKFPAFTMSSMVKNQNLAFKIPSAMATTIMYGSNRYLKSSVKDPQHDNSDLMAVFAYDTEPEYKDNLLHGLELTFRAEGWESNKIGSERSDPNSKIGKDTGELKIRYPLLTQISQKTGTDGDPIKGEADKYKVPDSTFQYRDSSLYEVRDAYLERSATTRIAHVPDVTIDATDVKTHMYSYDSNVESLTIRDEALQVLRSELHGENINAKERRNIYQQHLLIPAELSLEIDGIAGILPGDIIQTDYIQKKYNESIIIERDLGPFTYFQVVNVNQKISSAGWTTELETKMRVNRDVLNDTTGKVMEQLKTDTIARGFDPIPGPAPRRPSIPVPSDDEDIEGDFTDEDFDEIEWDNFDNMPKPPPIPTTELPPTTAGLVIPGDSQWNQNLFRDRFPRKFDVTITDPETDEPLEVALPVASLDIDIPVATGGTVIPGDPAWNPNWLSRKIPLKVTEVTEVVILERLIREGVGLKDGKLTLPPAATIPPCNDGTGENGKPLFTKAEYNRAVDYIFTRDMARDHTFKGKAGKRGKGSGDGAGRAFDELIKYKGGTYPPFVDLACKRIAPIVNEDQIKKLKDNQTDPKGTLIPGSVKSAENEIVEKQKMVEADNPGNISSGGPGQSGEPELISTYKGQYWQNSGVLYKSPHKPEWRPPPQGPKDKSYFGEAVNAKVPFEERKKYWDANIEDKNETGISQIAH